MSTPYVCPELCHRLFPPVVPGPPHPFANVFYQFEIVIAINALCWACLWCHDYADEQLSSLEFGVVADWYDIFLGSVYAFYGGSPCVEAINSFVSGCINK